jgi:hypothetical protein
VKRVSTWDTYVKEAQAKGDRSIEVPVTDDEVYVVNYPTRRQGRHVVESQLKGDTDGVLIGLLGDEAGGRVKELAEDHPAYVLDEFILDVMRKFGMIPDDAEDDEAPSTVNGRANGRSVKGKAAPSSRRTQSSSGTKRKTPSVRSAAASS